MTAIFGQEAGVADEATEDGVGDAGHGREDGRRGDAHIADLDKLRYDRALKGAAGDRSVPVLAHEVILAGICAFTSSRAHSWRTCDGSVPRGRRCLSASA